jgi:alpha/beta superfamily hydrolase
MKSSTQPAQVTGPAGAIECAIDQPAHDARGVAVLCHPHPQFGGTMDNKVVQTLARACVSLGYTSVRFNFRGVGASAGAWDEGAGEVDDALAVVAAHRRAGMPLLLGGFSFGGYVAASAAARLPEGQRPQQLLLVAPAVVNFSTPAVPAGSLLIHGELDDVVPLQALLDWARPPTQPLTHAVTVLPGAGHFFHGQLTLLKQVIVGGIVAAAPHPSP